MRFIHTADWHLGRLFHGVHLTEDQSHVLRQFLDVVRDAKPDVVLVAGDIYDRAIPPPEAVDLLDEVLSRLVLDLQVPTILIAGNHDSPGRLNFGARLLAGRKLYVTGTLPARCVAIPFADGAGPVHIYPVPYAEPAVVRQCMECTTINDHDSAMRALCAAIRAGHTDGVRSILVGHAFVAGGAESESERPLSVGGAGTVDASCFDGFEYVALGHLHSPQRISAAGEVRYCGSLLKYSFEECAQAKGVYVVEMDAAGACTSTHVPLVPRRDVRRISGTIAELLRGPADGKGREDYIEATITDDGPVLDAVGRLREVYPNLLNLRRPERELGALSGDRPNVRGMDEPALFNAFYKHVTGGDLSPDQERAFAETVDAMRQVEREVQPS